MKKLITFVLLMFVGIGLVGCQNDSKKSEGNPKVKQSKVHTAKSEPFQELIDSSKSTDEIYVTDDITVGQTGCQRVVDGACTQAATYNQDCLFAGL